MLRHSFHNHHISQRFYHPGARPSPFSPDHQTLPCVFIDQVQHPHRPASVCTHADKVIAPYMVGVLWTQPHARAIVEPQPPSCLLIPGYLQSFATPDALDPVLANSPACSLQQRRNPAIAVTPVLTGQLDDGLGQSIFVFPLCRSVAFECRVAASPPGTPAARSSHDPDEHDSPHSAVVPGLEVSRGDVLQHQLLQAQLTHQPLQLGVFLLQFL